LLQPNHNAVTTPFIRVDANDSVIVRGPRPSTDHEHALT